jgi:hypothetical protein
VENLEYQLRDAKEHYSQHFDAKDKLSDTKDAIIAAQDGYLQIINNNR